MSSHTPHRTVLLEEAVAALEIKASGAYVDATFGRGGHSRAILERRFAASYASVGFTPPYPSWPIAAEAFEEALSLVSARLAEVAHEQAEQLKALEKYKRKNWKKYQKQFKSINSQIEQLIRQAHLPLQEILGERASLFEKPLEEFEIKD